MQVHALEFKRKSPISQTLLSRMILGIKRIVRDANPIGISHFSVTKPSDETSGLATISFWVFFDQRSDALACKDRLYDFVFERGHPESIREFTCLVVETELELGVSPLQSRHETIPLEFPLKEVLDVSAASRLRNAFGLTHLSQLTQLTVDELQTHTNVGPSTARKVLLAMEEHADEVPYLLEMLEVPIPLHARQLDLLPIGCGGIFLGQRWFGHKDELSRRGIMTLADLRVASRLVIESAFSDRTHSKNADVEMIFTLQAKLSPQPAATAGS